jgi:hypothetical protein
VVITGESWWLAHIAVAVVVVVVVLRMGCELDCVGCE